MYTIILQTETKDRSILDPANATKQALRSLFFVPNHPSVLLKHGSIVLHNVNSTANIAAQNDLANGRHLMLFSHGFLVADVAVVHAFRLFLALNDRDIITENSFLGYLHAKLFKRNGHDSSGECNGKPGHVRYCRAISSRNFLHLSHNLDIFCSKQFSIRAQETAT